jgi:hypothetical protein
VFDAAAAWPAGGGEAATDDAATAIAATAPDAASITTRPFLNNDHGRRHN